MVCLNLLHLVTPDEIVVRVEDIDVEALMARGIKAILLDFDNTICPWHSNHPEPEIARWIADAKDRMKFCIVSNTIRPRRLNHVAESLGIPAIGRWFIGRKPFLGAFRAALKQLGLHSNETVMVGDQLLTDVMGGKRMGMYTVWVQPLEEREFAGTKVSRAIERMLERHFARLGMLPEGWEKTDCDE